jgi:hypothetical protein
MTDAYVIHAGEQAAGIVVRAPGGFHFFAALPALFALEGRLFAGFDDLHRAIDDIRSAARPQPTDRPRANWGRRFHAPIHRAA